MTNNVVGRALVRRRRSAKCERPVEKDIAGYVLDSGGYGLAAFRGADALDRAKTCLRFRQRDEGVPAVAVGMPITRHPPHRPVLALLTHTVPALDMFGVEARI